MKDSYKIKIKRTSNEDLFRIATKLNLQLDLIIRVKDLMDITYMWIDVDGIIIGYELDSLTSTVKIIGEVNGKTQYRNIKHYEYKFTEGISKKDISKLKKMPTFKIPKIKIDDESIQSYFYYKDAGIELNIDKFENVTIEYDNFKNSEILKQLQDQMELAVSEENYELAATLRDYITSINNKSLKEI